MIKKIGKEFSMKNTFGWIVGIAVLLVVLLALPFA